jgi:type I restriction enzyme S subunit
VRLSSVTAKDLAGTRRFDAKFYVSRTNPILARLQSGQWTMRSIGETFGRNNIWTGNIFTRVYATAPEHGKPLLVPYDLFRYVPWSDKILSRTQVAQFSRLEVTRGWIFIVCSGRNLGPLTIADAFCERFTMSHDMVRIAVPPSEDSFYVAAFLSTAAGQAALRTDMNGSVIDHTDANQVAAVRYPLIEETLRKACATKFRHAFEKREKARLLLAATQEAYLRHFKLAEAEAEFTEAQTARRFTVTRSSLGERIDAEPKAPRYAEWRQRVKRAGGTGLHDIAEVSRPNSRYKTNYVADPQYGVLMMNGRQISQYRPIALRSMSLAAMKEPEAFRLKVGMTLLTADGRAEENLADCALVSSDREGWGASGHVHRVTPREGVHPGVVYLACSCWPSQLQLKSLATGSVVDALSTSDVESVVVPYSDSAAVRRLGDDASKAWQLFADAYGDEQNAISTIDQALL